MPPYSQILISKDMMVRTFEPSISDHELEWHMDRRDRHVRVLEGTGWSLQLESGLPAPLVVGETYFIPKKSWHRVIKGNGKLMIEIKESSKEERSSMRSEGSKMKDRKVHIVREGSEERFRIFLAEVGARAATMEAQGYSDAQRRQYIADAFNEALRKSRGTMISEDAAAPSTGSNVLGFAEKLSNAGFFQGIQGHIADWFLGPIADKIGVPRDGYVYKVLHNVAENMDAATVRALIAGNGCKPLAAKFAGAMQESVVETILQQFGIAQSGFSKILAESLQAAFVENGPFVETLSKHLCEIDFASLIPGGGLMKSVTGLFGGGKKSADDKKPAGGKTPVPGTTPAS
jgi:uncharacterized protein YejL (UPF0352 family)